MKLSVIISAFDRHELTVAHVREDMKATVVPDEIIVVNDHGTPDLREMLFEIPDRKCQIVYAYILEDIPWNYTGARNLGFLLSRGDFIQIEDNDTIPAHDYYELALKLFEEKPEVERINSFARWFVTMDEVINKPMEEWKPTSKGAYHQDSNMLRRDTIIRMKGWDENFAGKYAWQSTDWRRRLQRAGIIKDNVGMHYVAKDGETHTLIRRKSGENYALAKGKTHTQPPNGMIRFRYTFERI